MDITNFWTNPVGICCAYLLMNHCDVATEACAFRKLAACLVFRQKEPRRACQLRLLRMVLDDLFVFGAAVEPKKTALDNG